MQSITHLIKMINTMKYVQISDKTWTILSHQLYNLNLINVYRGKNELNEKIIQI